MNIQNLVKKYEPDMIGLRRHLHMYPELSEKEYETCKYIGARLDEKNIPYTVLSTGRSIVAEIRGAFEGPTIVLRSDIDALPIQEETDLEFQSKVPGVMHACGHDAHAAWGLGAALILNDIKESLCGTVKILFQEAEELATGAQKAVDSGLLDDCDRSLMLHVNADRPTGQFVINYGVRCAKLGDAKIRIQGKAGHSSTPHAAVNPLLIGARIITAIADLTAYEIPRGEYVVCSPTVCHSGSKSNIIPDTCEIEVNARYFDDKYDEFLCRRITEISTGIAAAMGGSAEVEFQPSGALMINDKDATDLGMEIIRKYWGEDSIIMTPPGLFGDDFAFIQQKIPGLVVNIGCAIEGKPTWGHNPHMYVDEKAILVGAEFVVRYITEYLQAK